MRFFTAEPSHEPHIQSARHAELQENGVCIFRRRAFSKSNIGLSMASLDGWQIESFEFQEVTWEHGNPSIMLSTKIMVMNA